MNDLAIALAIVIVAALYVAFLIPRRHPRHVPQEEDPPRPIPPARLRSERDATKDA